jgi:protein O-mannosyl-transferase
MGFMTRDTPPEQLVAACDGADASVAIDELGGALGHRALELGGLLLAAVALVYGRTLLHGFVNFDDQDYVYQNPPVSGGLTRPAIGWAFTQFHSCNWHPLTWLSHMLDCQCFGLQPAGHHLTNILLHAASTLLLFGVLRRMTGRLAPSALVAAIFAVHPLHVESVAWIAERKDVLSGLFFMLTLWVYDDYARRTFSLARYGAVLGLFVLGLMSKPMLVTLPLVLLLLDYWPLGRLTGGWWHSRVLLEKMPLAGLSVASCAVTILAQQHGKATTVLALGLPWRSANAVVAYVEYLRLTCVPRGLAVFYPHPRDRIALLTVAGSALVLLFVTAAATGLRRRCPYLLVGWLWYLGMLVPVIGLLQVGEQRMADRYMYLPIIGLAIMAVWGSLDLCDVATRAGASQRQWPRQVWLAAWSLAVAILTIVAVRQASYWRDSETLWNRALACTVDNDLVEYNLGITVAQQGRGEEALRHFREAVRINPEYAEALNNLGAALAASGRRNEAIANFEKALQIAPNNPEAHSNLGLVLVDAGRPAEAIPHLQAALRTNPSDVSALYTLGLAYYQRGEDAAAVQQWRKTLDLRPHNIQTLQRLSWLLATSPQAAVCDGAEAVRLAQDAAQRRGSRDATMLDTLAAAFAASGDFPRAARTADQALTLANRTGNTAAADAIAARLQQYRRGQPCREPVQARGTRHGQAPAMRSE